MLATLTSMTRRHSSSGIWSNGRMASEAYRPALLTRTSMRPQRSTASSAMRATSSSEETSTVRPTPSGKPAAASSARWRSATTMRAPSAARPCGDRVPDALRRPGDERDLPGELHLIGEKATGTRMRLTCVWMSGWIFARNACQAGSACSFFRRSSRSPASG